MAHGHVWKLRHCLFLFLFVPNFVLGQGGYEQRNGTLPLPHELKPAGSIDISIYKPNQKPKAPKVWQPKVTAPRKSTKPSVLAEPENHVADYIQRLVDASRSSNSSDASINPYYISRRIRQRFALRGYDVNHLTSQQLENIYEEYFSEEMVAHIRRFFMATARSSMPNVVLTADSGRGKSHLSETLALMYTFNIMPDYLRLELKIEDPEGKATVIADSFFGRTEVFYMDPSLLSKTLQNSRKTPANSANSRMITTVVELFEAAEKQHHHKNEDLRKRTIIIADEAHLLDATVVQELKKILDRGGFRPDNTTDLRHVDPGFHLVPITTQLEWKKLVKADAAVERRFKPILIPPLSDAATLEIARKKALAIGLNYNILVEDDAIRYLIKLKDHLEFPAAAAPATVLNAVDEMILWKIQYPGNVDPDTVSLADAKKYFVYSRGLPDTWLEGPNGEPPFHDIADRLKKHVVGQDEAIAEIAEILQTWRRFGFGRKPPIIFLGGETGAGKDEIAKAVSMVLYGHDGQDFLQNLAGLKGDAVSAAFKGPPRGNHSDQLGSTLREKLERYKGLGSIILNEGLDMSSTALDEGLKVFLDTMAIHEEGVDLRECLLLMPVFVIGQWGEHLFKGKSPEEKIAIYNALTSRDIEKAFGEGKPGSEGTIGALSAANIGRAYNTGGTIIILKPHIPSNIVLLSQKFADRATESFIVEGYDVLLSEKLVAFIADVGIQNEAGSRLLNGTTFRVTKRAINRANHLGLPTTSNAVYLDYRVEGQVPYIDVHDMSSKDGETFSIPLKSLMGRMSVECNGEGFDQ